MTSSAFPSSPSAVQPGCSALQDADAKLPTCQRLPGTRSLLVGPRGARRSWSPIRFGSAATQARFFDLSLSLPVPRTASDCRARMILARSEHVAAHRREIHSIWRYRTRRMRRHADGAWTRRCAGPPSSPYSPHAVRAAVHISAPSARNARKLSNHDCGGDGHFCAGRSCFPYSNDRVMPCKYLRQAVLHIPSVAR